MSEKIRELDEQLFLFLNGLHNEFFDVVMYWVTYKYTWYPVYLLLIVLVVWKYRWQGALMMLGVVIAVGLSDQLTSGFMKPYFGRLRPCHDPDLQGMVHVVAGCGGRFGFASSHASTTFGLAMSLWLMLRGWTSKFAYAFVWAALVSYSRIYVGVHYPADILIGALGGVMTGLVVYMIYSMITQKIYGIPIHTKAIEEREGIV